MGIRLDALHQHIIKKYGFEVGDWDNRPNIKGLVLLGKSDFSNGLHLTESKISPVTMNLQGLDVERVGEVFNTVFQRFQNCEINGEHFQPTHIFLRLASDDKIPDKPFLFIAGTKKMAS
jgi:hypothetical protein